MSNFTSIHMDANTGTDGSASWTSWAFGGTSGASELRFCATSAGGASTSSSSWPLYTLPGSTGVVPEAWLFTTDTSGAKINYDGTSAHYLELRYNWDNAGTFASAPSFTCYSDTSHAAASPGTQPGAQSGSPIVNGSSDTSNTSYLKANAYGYGLTAGGAQQTPSANAGGTLLVTSGTNGSVSPGSAAWLGTWQSLQSTAQFITNGNIPAATTAGLWYLVLALYCGPTMSTSSAMLPCLTLSYTYV